jgi:cytochrome c biogenesis protein CcmG, thiol:disulfide interchange protein DsbE
MRRIAYALAAIALVAVVIVGLTQAGGDARDPAPEADSFDLEQARAELRGAPAPLAALHGDAGKVLEGDEFQPALDSVKGTPAVINKWASWCGPCRAEFPIFQQVATERGKDIAFLGLNAKDARPAAERFLADFPVPFPSYEDENEEIARKFRAGTYFPMTVFVDGRGKTEFVHAGEYTSAAELEADIDKYLGE